jgi:hypothetical protein
MTCACSKPGRTAKMGRSCLIIAKDYPEGLVE